MNEFGAQAPSKSGAWLSLCLLTFATLQYTSPVAQLISRPPSFPRWGRSLSSALPRDLVHLLFVHYQSLLFVPVSVALITYNP